MERLVRRIGGIMEEEIRETGLAEESGNRMVSVDFSW